jgi:hypothetical protein
MAEIAFWSRCHFRLGCVGPSFKPYFPAHKAPIACCTTACSSVQKVKQDNGLHRELAFTNQVQFCFDRNQASPVRIMRSTTASILVTLLLSCVASNARLLQQQQQRPGFGELLLCCLTACKL